MPLSSTYQIVLLRVACVTDSQIFTDESIYSSAEIDVKLRNGPLMIVGGMFTVEIYRDKAGKTNSVNS